MIKGRFSAFKARLTTMGREEPLNKLSLATIILLDIFILVMLFQGLEDHTRQLTSPNEYMPHTARQVFIEQAWTPDNRIGELQELVLSDRTRYSFRHSSMFEQDKVDAMHPLCRDFYERVKSLAEDPPLQDLFIARQRILRERQDATENFNKTKSAYDTRLLENMASNDTSNQAAALARQAKATTARLESLTDELARTEQQIDAHPGIQALWRITGPENQNRQQVIDDFRRYERWYPLKELGWQLLFILPLFFLFKAWGTRSVRKDNGIQTLIASHLLVIASLPIIVKGIELVLDLIPNYFFKNLFKLLHSLHLIAIWHYLVIFGAIALGLFLVYLIQKKVFNKRKIMQKRLMKGACFRCSKTLPTQAAVCPFCGTRQSAPCSSCGKETPVAGLYCIHCGTAGHVSGVPSADE